MPVRPPSNTNTNNNQQNDKKSSTPIEAKIVIEEEEEDEEEDDEEEDGESPPPRLTCKITILGGVSVRGDKLLHACQDYDSDELYFETWTVDEESRFHDKFMLKMLVNKSRVIFLVFSLVDIANSIKNVITWFEEANKTHDHYYPILVGTEFEKLAGSNAETRKQIDDTVHELAKKMRAAIVYVADDSFSTAVRLAGELIKASESDSDSIAASSSSSVLPISVNSSIENGPIVEYAHALNRIAENKGFNY